MTISLLGKRYSELNPTSIVEANSLVAVFRIGQPELNRTTFQEFQNNIRLVNLFDSQGEILTNGALFRYSTASSKFTLGLLQEADVPNLPISKVTGLQTALDGKEPTFTKGSVTSTTLQIVNGADRLVGAADMEIDFDIGAIDFTGDFVPLTRTLTGGDGINAIGDLTVDRTISVDTTVLRTGSATQTRTGLMRFVRGSGAGEILHTAFDYPDNNGEDYNLRLYNDGSNNNVRWYFKQKVTVGVNVVTLDVPVIGFKNGVTMIGSDNNPLTEIDTYYNAQTNPVTRYPLVLYTEGDSMFTGRIYAGKNNFLNTLFLTSGDTLYSEGTVYARGGLRTPHPDTTLENVAWLLGDAGIQLLTPQDPDVFIRISIDGTEWDLFAKTVL